ncbi:MAG: hypothetical protein K6C13_16260 [Oscillospiraceae bacterium]|nr:hypothetical protein [Oscillospiraceae bacterium]
MKVALKVRADGSDETAYTVFEDYEHFDKNFPGGMVLWYVDKSIKKRCLSVGHHYDLGVCLTHCIFSDFYDKERDKISRGSFDHIAVYNKLKLKTVVDIYDGLLISEGLFFPIDIAWIAMKEFIATGKMSLHLEWIIPESMPDEGNWG